MDEARFSTDTKTYYSRVERNSLKVVIDEKVTKMESALKVYSTRGRGSSEIEKTRIPYAEDVHVLSTSIPVKSTLDQLKVDISTIYI